jgi:hypothetical protein
LHEFLILCGGSTVCFLDFRSASAKDGTIDFFEREKALEMQSIITGSVQQRRGRNG